MEPGRMRADAGTRDSVEEMFRNIREEGGVQVGPPG
jgi:hypothetical protein